MAERLNFKTWDNSPSFSSNFKMISKYTDLGSADGKKTLLGVVFNVSVGTESTAANHSSYIFSISYRKGLNSPFRFLTLFNNVFKSTISNKGNVEVVKMLPIPIKDVSNIQLQIKGYGIRNDIGINDLGLIFRTYRDSSTVNFNEE